MKKVMEKLSKNELITLYSEDIEEFVSGFIYAVRENEAVLACVDRFGDNNGFLVLKMEGIYRIDWGSDYERKLYILYCDKKQYHDQIEFSEENMTLSETILRWAYLKNKPVMIDFYEADAEIYGYIENIDDLKIKKIDIYECKPEQGYAYILPESEKYIWIDERRMRDAGLVYKLRGK